MIILKHLTVERFRLLREIDLHFPQRGSVLIQGPNEAGKSTLFESIYFALYGESLTSKRKKRTQDEHERYDDLILYGENEAHVTLILTIGPSELIINRSIKRGIGQEVSLSVRRLGVHEERITSLDAANERILSEIGHIDGTILRNSCLIEQKALNRVEQLSGREREATLHTLLGLEKLTRLTEQFKLTDEDERLLTESRELLELAEVQSRIPNLSIQLGQLEAALDAVTIREDLLEVDKQEAEIAEQELALEHLQHKREQLKSLQNRIQQLRKAQNILSEIINAYETIARTQRELPDLERQLSEIERHEVEELPALEQLVQELSDLTKSFGTLERMAADLLAAVNSIKGLEQELKQHQHIQAQLAEIDDQIIKTRLLVDEVQQSQQELEAQFRTARPQLEARLQRLQALSDRFSALEEMEKMRANTLEDRAPAEENSVELAKVNAELQEAEQKLALVEGEAKQSQDRTDDIEKHWRQLSIRHQLEEWLPVKGQSQKLSNAEQNVKNAHDQQEQLTLTLLAMRRTATLQIGIFIACIVLFILCGIGALVQATHHSFFVVVIGIAVLLLLLLGAGISVRNYRKTREKERHADQQMQEAISRVGMMVAARETAMRMSGGPQALTRIEQEIRSLDGTVPRSAQEATSLLQQIPDSNESLADLQQQLTTSRQQTLSVQSQVNAVSETVEELRKKQLHLQDLRHTKGWHKIDEKIRDDEETIAHMRSEITTAAGEEGLSNVLAPVHDAETTSSSSTTKAHSDEQLRVEVEEAFKATEQEIANIESKREALPELVLQRKGHQEALEELLARKLTLMKQHEELQANDPLRRIERAREQQAAFRDALRSLQDSLRQRVQSLGLSFGQTAISTAEAAARKQLESLHLSLARKLEIQDRHTKQATLLKESQESLSEYYRQLAKYSGSAGNWIIPSNPFAETLQNLHTRCEREIHEANESALLQGLYDLKKQEDASLTKIDVCKHEIELAHERIAETLKQRNRPSAKTYTLADISAVWPLLSEYSPQDRTQLEKEVAAVELELQELERKELEFSTRLKTGSEKLDLGQAHQCLQKQEYSYKTKKRGGLLINATVERLMLKMIPRIEYYIQQLLPVLTRGRYHDVTLSTEPEEGVTSGGPFQLNVWEQAAAEYIPQSALSGGTADLISLTLRLAFVIAALPRELNAAPGFILLDEPLSQASQDRMQALIDLVTSHLLSDHFEQALFISHNSALDLAMFTYHLYIDNGLVMESNLPVETAIQEQSQPSIPTLAGTNEHSNNESVVEPQVMPL
ncbi:MAG TPA: AAA family ATPase [Ktedonobacteraceae bacterium]|nr:AAA family ATPase [Ktedonobacteraceae bacterium]